MKLKWQDVAIAVFCLARGVCMPLEASAPGSTSANFLKIPVGARATGMGGTFVSVADDSSAIYWNPAGLRAVRNTELSFLHTRWLGDMSYQYLTAAFPVTKDRWSGGAGIYMLNYGDIQGWDYLGNKTKNLTASDMAISIGIAAGINDIVGLSDDLYAGATLKHITENLDTKAASAISADVGFLYKKKFSFSSLKGGLSARNIVGGGGLTFVSESCPLPSVIALGASYTLNEIIGADDPLTFSAEFNMPSDNKSYFTVGSEYRIINLIALRLGYRTGGQDIGSGFRAGLGVRVYTMDFDVAFGGYEQLGDTYNFGITWKFGDAAVVKPRITTEPISSDEIDVLIKSANKLYEEKRYVECMFELNKVLDADPTNKSALDMLKKANEQLKLEQNDKNSGENK